MKVYAFANTTEGIIEMENSLESEQKFVGGHIEVISIGNEIDLVCNEEGKINCLQPTVAWIEEGKIIDIICGDCFLCRHNEEGDFVSIKDEDIEYIQSKLFPVAGIIDKTICITKR